MQIDVLTALSRVIESRKKADANQSYVASLHAKGLDAVAGKVIEEANETVQAAISGDVDQVVYETADLWFHSLVLLSHFNLTHEEVLNELDAVAGRVIEEANETVQAAISGDVDQVVYETADLWFHSLVLLSHFNLTHEEVLNELDRRFGVSGLEEKKLRR
jgi:phosphoribosyl-ATP pyrophosphohydrolase